MKQPLRATTIQVTNVLATILAITLLIHSANAIQSPLSTTNWPFDFAQDQNVFLGNVLAQFPYTEPGYLNFFYAVPTIQFQPLFAYLYTLWHAQPDNTFLEKINHYQPGTFDTEVKKYFGPNTRTFLTSNFNRSMYLNLVGLKVLTDQNTQEKYLPPSMKIIPYPKNNFIELLSYFDWSPTAYNKSKVTEESLRGTLFAELGLGNPIVFKDNVDTLQKVEKENETKVLDHLAKALKNIAA